MFQRFFVLSIALRDESSSSDEDENQDSHYIKVSSI